MVSHQEVEIVAGKGIVGDRYLLGTGHWSDPPWPDQELTLFEAEVAERLGLPAEAFRRNIVVRGLPLHSLIGAEFRIGEVPVLGVRRCDPCRYLEAFTRPGMFEELRELGGLRCAVIEGGRVRLGDRVQLA